MASTTYFIYYTPSLALGSHKATYTRDQINKAVIRALGLLKAGHQIGDGDGRFPQAFAKAPVDGAHAHVQGPFFTFPLHAGGTHDGEGDADAGDSGAAGAAGAGPDRVVFGSVNKAYTSAVFVAVAGPGPDHDHEHDHSHGHGLIHKLGHSHDDKTLTAFADTSVNHARAQPHDFEGHEAAEGHALKPLVPTAEDTAAQDLLTDDDVKVALH